MPPASAASASVSSAADSSTTESSPPADEGDWPDVPKLEPAPPLEVEFKPTTPAVCKKRGLVALLPPKLEALASHGDACAASTLADKLVTGRPFPEAWRRALRYAMVALDQGAAPSCDLFEIARDFPRLASCFERNGDLGPLALAYATGSGVKRDIARARKLAEEVGTVSAVVEEEARKPSGRLRPFCRDAAQTSIDVIVCLSRRMLRYDYASAPAREKAFRSLDEDGQKALSKLNRAFFGYADAEGWRAGMNYVCGTMRGAQGLGRQLATREAFDEVLSQAVVKRDLPRVSEDDVAELTDKVRKREAEQRSSIGSCSEDGVKPWRAHQKLSRVGSERTYAAYEKAFVALVKPLYPEEGDGERRIRVALLRQRVEALEDRGD